MDLHGQPVLITYAALPSLGWTLAIVVLLNEVTAQAQSVATAIQSDDLITQRTMLWVENPPLRWRRSGECLA